MVDTWKQKQWYKLISPKFLGEVEISEVPATDEEHLLNRIVSLPLKEVTHDLSHMYTTIRLRVEKISGKNAFAKFIGHATSRDYLSTLARRNRDLLRVVFTVLSKDGVKFHVKCLVVTAVACSTAQRKQLRNETLKTLKEIISQKDFSDFIQSVLYNRAAQEVHTKLKKIAPIKRIEIYKTELYEVFDVKDVVELDRQRKVRQDAVKAEEAANVKEAEAGGSEEKKAEEAKELEEAKQPEAEEAKEAPEAAPAEEPKPEEPAPAVA